MEIDPTVAIDAYRREIKLEQRGDRYFSTCPFHNERAPSFCVFPDGRFKCFGCGVHGDAIDFIRQLRGLGFFDALGELGIEREKPIDRREIERRRLERLSREWRIADLSYTLALLIRTTRKAMRGLMPDNFDEFIGIVESLSWWEYLHDCLGDDQIKDQVLSDLEDFPTCRRNSLFRRDFDLKTFLRAFCEKREPNDAEKNTLQFSLDDLKRVLYKWFYLESTTAVDVIVATHIANLFDADPLWMLLIAPPSNTKTELLRAFDGYPDAVFISNLTPATLVSGILPKKSRPDPFYRCDPISNKRF